MITKKIKETVQKTMASGMSEAPGIPLLVPSGTPLIPGKLYLQLYHGRRDPDEELDDWGIVGPTFGPLVAVFQTYFATMRIRDEHGQELRLLAHDDMIVWDDCYFGDISVFVARDGQTG